MLGLNHCAYFYSVIPCRKFWRRALKNSPAVLSQKSLECEGEVNRFLVYACCFVEQEDFIWQVKSARHIFSFRAHHLSLFPPFILSRRSDWGNSVRERISDSSTVWVPKLHCSFEREKKENSINKINMQPACIPCANCALLLSSPGIWQLATVEKFETDSLKEIMNALFANANEFSVCSLKNSS